MPKVENPISGKQTDLFNWKGILGLVGGAFLLIGVFVLGRWVYTKISGVVGAPQSGSNLNDVLGGI